MTDEQLLDLFKKSNAILNGHFCLTSGKHSDTYLQCALLFEHGDISVKIAKEASKRLKAYKADYIVSPAVGAIILGYELAKQRKIPNVFAERQNEKFALRRGFNVPEGANVIVAENVVTTGGSVFEVIDMLKARKINVLAVTSVVDRSNGKVDFGVPFVPLLRLDVSSYDPSKCPLCKKNIPIDKPGSKGLKA